MGRRSPSTWQECHDSPKDESCHLVCCLFWFWVMHVEHSAVSCKPRNIKHGRTEYIDPLECGSPCSVVTMPKRRRGLIITDD